MASSFEVAVEQVDSLANHMDRVSATFDDVSHKRPRNYRGYADAAPVEKGLGEFFGKWTDGMDRIHKKLDAVAERLHYAVDAYSKTEQDVIDSAKGS